MWEITIQLRRTPLTVLIIEAISTCLISWPLKTAISIFPTSQFLNNSITTWVDPPDLACLVLFSLFFEHSRVQCPFSPQVWQLVLASLGLNLDLIFFDLFFLKKPPLVPPLEGNFANRTNCLALCFFSVSSILHSLFIWSWISESKTVNSKYFIFYFEKLRVRVRVTSWSYCHTSVTSDDMVTVIVTSYKIIEKNIKDSEKMTL